MRLGTLLLALPIAAFGAEPNAELYDAATAGDVPRIALAIEHGADVNAPKLVGSRALFPLYWAVNSNNLEAVLLLLAAGANPNAGSPDDAPIFRAGDTRIVGALLDHKADPNVKTTKLNITPLTHAARCRKETFVALKKSGGWKGPFPRCEETVRLLIRAGARLDEPGFGGETPLMAAASSGNYEIAQLLISEGARFDLRDGQGMTALDVALHWYALERYERSHGHPDSIPRMFPMIKLLLEGGADPNHRVEGRFDQYSDAVTTPYLTGYTPIGLAARHGWYSVAKLLLDHGADATVPRSDGLTPSEIARKHAHYKTERLINDHISGHGAPASQVNAAR
jgi:ankyrin repeat protein